MQKILAFIRYRLHRTAGAILTLGNNGETMAALIEYCCLTVIVCELVMGNIQVLNILKVWMGRPILSIVKHTSRA